jgi:hypothetical protein
MKNEKMNAQTPESTQRSEDARACHSEGTRQRDAELSGAYDNDANKYD